MTTASTHFRNSTTTRSSGMQVEREGGMRGYYGGDAQPYRRCCRCPCSSPLARHREQLRSRILEIKMMRATECGQLPAARCPSQSSTTAKWRGLIADTAGDVILPISRSGGVYRSGRKIEYAVAYCLTVLLQRLRFVRITHTRAFQTKRGSAHH